MKTLQEIATMTPAQQMNYHLDQVHTQRAVSNIDGGMNAADAVRYADRDMFNLLTTNDLFAGEVQPEF